MAWAMASMSGLAPMLPRLPIAGRADGRQPGVTGVLAAQGPALRQVVALLIAHRRPSFYLLNGRHELATLTDSYLRLLAQQQAISGRCAMRPWRQA